MDDKALSQLKKQLKKAVPEWVDGIEATATDALKSKVSTLALEIDKVEQDRDTNDKILQLRDQLDDSVGPYRDTLRLLRAEIRYIAHLLNERGAA